jgi:membrane protease YdiL (CAAX protease family)
VLAVANVMSNRVIPSWAYVPWSLAVAATIVLLARRSVPLAEMGFTEWRRGLAWGGVLFVLTVAVLALAVAMPVFNEMYHDRRVRGTASGSTRRSAHPARYRRAGEAFHAVLPGLFAHGGAAWRLAASLFRFWHVLPAELNEVNPTATRCSARRRGVAAVVFASWAPRAGLWWCWIRYRAHSVLATIIAHVASNSVAYTIAFVVSR